MKAESRYEFNASRRDATARHGCNRRIADLWELVVSLKPEFNADNRAIYAAANLLATGDASGWKPVR